MDERANNTDEAGEDPSREPAPAPSRLSRRDFATRFGAGSAAAVGVAWASPHISTIKFAAKAAVGSPAPTQHGGSTTTTTTVPGEVGGMSVSGKTPCVGDVITIHARGFVPRTAVTLEIDSPENVLGVTTAGPSGRVNVSVQLPTNGPTGAHNLIAVGVQPGGRTLSLSIPITIKTEEECRVGPEGSTTTSGPTTTAPPGTPTTTATSTSVPTSTTIGAKSNHNGGGGGGGKPTTESSGFLAFTGTDSVDLALLGAAAAVGGRALFGLVAHHDEDEEEDE